MALRVSPHPAVASPVLSRRRVPRRAARGAMLVGCALAAFALAACKPDALNAPVPRRAAHSGESIATGQSYYAAPTGSADGDGSAANPWDLQTALAQPGVVQPGDTIWMRGGTYSGEFRGALTGTADLPVVVRQYPGEHAAIDGRLDVAGQYAYYWGFEVLDSDPQRVSAQASSDPTDLPRKRATVFVTGPYNKIINLVVHDLGDGLFSSAAAEGLEIYGSVFYNNGWLAPDGPKGHNLYLQNDGPPKTVDDNVLFNSFAYGVQIYGTEAATLYNFRVVGNSIFNSGAGGGAGASPQANILMRGADGRFGQSAFVDNNVYHENGLATSVQFGGAGDLPGEDIVFYRNTVQGQLNFNESRRYVVVGNRVTSGPAVLRDQAVLVGYRPPDADVSRDALQTNRWDDNVYASPAGNTQDPFFVGFSPDAPTLPFETWQSGTGFDATSSYVVGRLPVDPARDVVVRPNRYEPGRALITVWNPGDAGNALVDVSGVLSPGDQYEVHHVYDLFGAPVASGTYDGRPVVVPLTPRTAPAPIGRPSPAPSSNEFHVFLLQPLARTSVDRPGIAVPLRSRPGPCAPRGC